MKAFFKFNMVNTGIDKLPSQQDMANIAGTSRETVSRAINHFIKEGFISKKDNKLIIDRYEEFINLFC